LAQFFQTYFLFITALFWLGLFLLAFWWSPAHRRVMFYSGLLLLPAVSTDFLLVPDYWQPCKLFGLTAGLEDVLFFFAIGGLAWWVAADRFQRHLDLTTPLKCSLRRYVGVGLGGCGLTGLLFFLGASHIWSVLGSILMVGAFLIWWQAHLWRAILGSAAVFGVLYVLVFNFFALLWANFLSLWNMSRLSGVILGLPVEELVWALGFGFSWPLVVCYILDLPKTA